MQTNELLIQKVSQMEAMLTDLAKECRLLKTTIKGGVSTPPNFKKNIDPVANEVTKRNARLFKRKNLA